MNCRDFAFIPALAALAMTGCTQGAEPGGDRAAANTVAAPAAAGLDLPAVFDCVRETGGLLIASHRGGPAPGYPENAVETLQYGYDQGIRVFEIDAAESQDGDIILMHDRSLGRTTTGKGAVASASTQAIEALRLVDNDGTVTAFSVPTLDKVLAWAVEHDAILELDRKETTSFRNLIDAVRAAGAENNVILITYNDEEALQVAELAPEMMMTASIGNREHEAEMLANGLDATRLIAWTGTRRPSPGKWKGLASKGIESAFGTLGREGERLDDQYWADGDPSEYETLIEGKLVMLATDRPYEIAAADGPIGDAIEAANTVCLSGQSG